MRPIANQQDGQRYPLSEVFSAEAHVRILRVLSKIKGSYSAPEIAERTGLTGPGTQKALARLVNTGMIVRIGEGYSRQYAFQQGTHLATPIIQLFKAERNRYESLLSSIQSSAKQLDPPPKTVWIYREAPNGDRTLNLGLLQSARQLTQSVRQLRTGLGSVEQEFDVTIEITGYTKADLDDIDPSNIQILTGYEPKLDPMRDRANFHAYTHDQLDKRSEKWASAIATLIHKDPSLVRRAIRHLNTLLEKDQGSARHDLMEWKAILDSYPERRLIDFLKSQSPRATRLRQSAPFFAVLTESERELLRFSEVTP